MSFFIKRKLKDGRQIRSKYNYDTNKVLISKDDFEELLNESDVAYEQAKQLQTIIENLQEIKAESIKKVLDKIKEEIMDTGAYEQEVNGKTEFLQGINYCLSVIDRYKTESEKV
jgi:hypothetical protein